MDPMAVLINQIKVILIVVTAVSAQNDQISPQGKDAKIPNLPLSDFGEQLESMKFENIKLKNQLNAITSESNALKAANTKIIDGFMKVLGQMDAMKAENIALKAEYWKHMDAMEEKITRVADQFDALKVENIKIHSRSENLSQITTDFSDEDTLRTNAFVKVSFENQKSEHELDISKVRWMQNNYVSFTAYASVTREYEEGQKVMFDSVLRNYGYYYDAVESEFVCQATAYYLFTVSVRSSESSHMHADIYLDNELLVSASPQDGNYYDQGSNSVVTLCQGGQVVAVYVGCCTPNHMFGGRESSFTGVLLQIAEPMGSTIYQ